MYTRNYDKVRRHTGGGLPMQKERDTELIIPREYHGEMLRAANRTYEEPSGREPDIPEPRAMPVPKEEYTDITEDTGQKPDDDSRSDDSADTVSVEDDGTGAKDHEEEKEEHDSARGLAGGIFDLLLGKNSDEEETILLLGVALLLLSGHMDRGADGETWGEDDLALLLIGYLLLG